MNKTPEIRIRKNLHVMFQRNPHRLYSEPMGLYIEECDCNISPEHEKRCLQTDEIWVGHFYPKNTVGFYTFAAPTLHELIDVINDANID